MESIGTTGLMSCARYVSFITHRDSHVSAEACKTLKRLRLPSTRQSTCDVTDERSFA